MNYVKKNNKKTKRAKVIILVCILATTFMFYRLLVYPNAVDIICAQVKALQSEAIAKGGQSLVFAQYYTELYYYDKNSAGDIVLIRANPYLINQLNYLTLEKMQKEIRNFASSNVKVPLGVFLGSPLLLGIGPDVTLKVVGIGATQCRLRSEFLSQGVNQTLHRHYIEVTTSIDVAVSFKVITISQIADIFISENLIVGKVPDAYLIGEHSGTYLDLLP